MIKQFKHCEAEMKPYTEMRDGLGLEDRLAENGDVLNQVQSEGVVLAVTVGGHVDMENDGNNSANESGNMLAGFITSI